MSLQLAKAASINSWGLTAIPDSLAVISLFPLEIWLTRYWELVAFIIEELLA